MYTCPLVVLVNSVNKYMLGATQATPQQASCAVFIDTFPFAVSQPGMLIQLVHVTSKQQPRIDTPSAAVLAVDFLFVLSGRAVASYGCIYVMNQAVEPFIR